MIKGSQSEIMQTPKRSLLPEKGGRRTLQISLQFTCRRLRPVSINKRQQFTAVDGLPWDFTFSLRRIERNAEFFVFTVRKAYTAATLRHKKEKKKKKKKKKKERKENKNQPGR